MRHMIETMTEIIAKFGERAKIWHQGVRYFLCLPDSWWHDNQGAGTTDWFGAHWKRKVEHGQTFGVLTKKPKGFDSRSKGQQVVSRYGKCSRSHDGFCRAGGSGCYKCNKIRHFRKDFIVAITTTHTLDLICFHCNQMGHKKANCPSLASRGPVVALAPATLQILEGL